MNSIRYGMWEIEIDGGSVTCHKKSVPYPVPMFILELYECRSDTNVTNFIMAGNDLDIPTITDAMLEDGSHWEDAVYYLSGGDVRWGENCTCQKIGALSLDEIRRCMPDTSTAVSKMIYQRCLKPFQENNGGLGTYTPYKYEKYISEYGSMIRAKYEGLADESSMYNLVMRHGDLREYAGRLADKGYAKCIMDLVHTKANELLMAENPL